MNRPTPYRVISVVDDGNTRYYVQYRSKFLGLIPYWKTLKKSSCNYEGCFRVTMYFNSRQDAAEGFCKRQQYLQEQQKLKKEHHQKVVHHGAC